MNLKISDPLDVPRLSGEHKPLRLPRLPRPGRPSEERRKLRTDHAGQALTHALNGAANRADLDAVLVVDDFGMLVSSNDTNFDLEMLAAVTPIVARGEAIAKVKHLGISRDFSVRTVQVLGETLHVAGLGGQACLRQRGVVSGAEAAARILA